MQRAGANLGQRQPAAGQQAVVLGRDAAAARVFSVQMAQLHAQDRSLELVQPAVEAGDVTDVALPPAVFPQQPHAFRQPGVTRDHRAPVPERPQILGRIKAERSDVADGAGHVAVVGRAVRLRAVFDHRQVVAARDRQDRSGVGRLTVEMHRDDRAAEGRVEGSSRESACGEGSLDCLFQSIRIHREVGRVDVHQHGRGAAHLDRGDRGDRGVRHGEDRKAGPHPAGAQRQVQRIRAAADADGVAHPQIGRELALEARHLLAQDIASALEDGRDGGVDLRTVCVIVGARVGLGDGHGHA